ncbi:MAG: hypothetical protein AABX91_02195 [Nanoarchaeota archaeon]
MRRGDVFRWRKVGQIWVETMVYTLIAFALIGLVLAFVKPKIEETQDKGVIEQSVRILESIDSVIRTLGGPGNQRVLEIGLNKGTIFVDGKNDTIFFKMDSKYIYSQPGENINVGGIIANTEKRGNIHEVTLIRNYSGEYNITFQNKDELKEITQASTPYKFIILDKGNNTIDIEVTN